MSRRTKLILMFSPFLVFFVAFAIVVNDLRHPRLSHDECIVMATGSDSLPHRKTGSFIYRQSSNVQNDVSLRCNRMGLLLLNDSQLFITPVKSGQGAEVSRKSYHFLPSRWMVNVRTGHETKR